MSTSARESKISKPHHTADVALQILYEGTLDKDAPDIEDDKEKQHTLEKLDLTKETCLLYTSPSPRDAHESRMPSSA